MKLFNSMSNKIEDFIPKKLNEISMYVCGPTVYNHAHIGNARPIIVFDTLRRYFEYLGFNVKYVSNYTDVDDKIIAKAIEEKVSEEEIAARYIEAYQKVREGLNTKVLAATPRVTETMDDIISFIQALIDVGMAYQSEGDVYFKVSESEKYGQLSNQKVDDLLVGARIDDHHAKESPIDFTLWKRTDEGIQWSSPWGMGRPGWHTECVVMIKKEFGGSMIDIHGGGMDLKFPHHENEIAQSMALYHHPIAQMWMHNGMLNIDGEKMSKSLGNVLWAKDILSQLGGDTVRWMMMSAHYRAPLNINEETIEQAKTELGKIRAALKQAYVKLQLAKVDFPKDVNREILNGFMMAMEDDLNSPNAMMEIFDAVKQLNQLLRVKDADLMTVAQWVVAIETMIDVFGIKIERIELSKDDIHLYDLWNQAKSDKDFVKADEYRKALTQRGIL
jgi:cysteinyl-tRNA synthetase